MIAPVASQHDDREAWLEERKHGIGASEMASVVNMNPYKGPVRLFMEKTGKVQPADLSDNITVRRGTFLEPFVAELYEEKTGRQVRLVHQIQVNPEHTWMRASVDRVTVGEYRNVQIKTSEHLDDGQWGPDGSDIAPIPYVIQVQSEMAVLGEQYQVSDIPVLSGRELRIITIKRDQEIIDWLIEEGERFAWHIANDVMPDAKTVDDLALRYPKSIANIVIATPDIYSDIDNLRALKASEKKIKTEMEAAALRIKLFMGESDTLKYGDEILATWRTSKTSMKLDQKLLKASAPEVHAMYCRESSTRPLLVKGIENHE